MCFLARGLFYTLVFPLWEPFDEPFHFAYVQRVAQGGGLPAPESPVSREVEASMKLVPLPWALGSLPEPYLVHDAWWRLPEAERRARREALRAIPGQWQREPGSGAQLQYEAQQPPLYYWLMAGPLRVAGRLSLEWRVRLLRWLSVLLASAVVPLGFVAARRVLGEGPAVGVVAVIAAMPELMIDLARVGNDSLAVVLFTLLLWLCLEERWTAAGAALGAGLLAKAYLLTAAPVVGWLLVRRRQWKGAVVAVAVAGWWYVGNWLRTGSLSGMKDAAFAGWAPPWKVEWWRVLDSIFFSHIWFGGWSFLQVRSWMYRVFAVLFVAGLALALRRRRGLGMVAAFYAAFWVGLAYHGWLMYRAFGQSSSSGWYLHCVVVAEAILLLAGWPRWGPRLATALFCLLDLYAMHFVLAPYYTGAIGHRANGAVEAFHGGWATLWDRLPWGVALAWPLYVVATLALLKVAYTERDRCATFLP